MRDQRVIPNPVQRTPHGVALLGFVRVPGLFYLILAGMAVAHLAMVQVVKTWFYRRFAAD